MFPIVRSWIRGLGETERPLLRAVWTAPTPGKCKLEVAVAMDEFLCRQNRGIHGEFISHSITITRHGGSTLTFHPHVTKNRMCLSYGRQLAAGAFGVCLGGSGMRSPQFLPGYYVSKFFLLPSFLPVSILVWEEGSCMCV